MTIPQIKGFLEAISRKTATNHAIFLSNIALGAQGSGKDIKKTVQTYAKATKKSKPKPKQTIKEGGNIPVEPPPLEEIPVSS